MAKEKTTPEEQLLKVIENPHLAQKRPVTAKEAVFTLKDIIGRLKTLRFDKNVIKLIDVRLVNKVIAVLCGIITVSFIGDMVYNKVYFNKRFNNIIAEPAEAVAKTGDTINLNVKLDDVLIQAKKHNIFTMLPPKENRIEQQDLSGPIELKLVGVLWSDNPQAMIENTREQKTYFVSTGDKIGVLTVKAIMQNRVIIAKDGQEWELR